MLSEWVRVQEQLVLAFAWFLSSLMMHGHIECTLSNAAPLVLSLQPPNSSAGNGQGQHDAVSEWVRVQEQLAAAACCSASV